VSGIELRLVLDDDQIHEIALAVADILRADLAPTTNTAEHFTVTDAANYLGITVGRLRKLIARRQIPIHQEAPGCRIVPARTDLDHYLANRRQEARS
jgi:excisionase family DNA binding protein